MRRHSWLTISAAALILCGCATTGYHPVDEGYYGYSERQLTGDTYEVSFAGNEHTSTEQVHDFALRHSAELAVSLGFTYLAVLDDESGPIPALGPGAAGASGGPTGSSPVFRDAARGNFTTLQVRYYNDASDPRGQHLVFAEAVRNVLEEKYASARDGY